MNTNHVTGRGCTSVQSAKSTQGIIIESKLSVKANPTCKVKSYSED